LSRLFNPTQKKSKEDMKKIYCFILIMNILASCNKDLDDFDDFDDFDDLKDVTLVIGDTENVKVERMDITIENSTYPINGDWDSHFISGIYNLDVNKDGINDFAICGYTHLSISKSPSFHWYIKPLSENNKVLCDTIISRESFFLATKLLFLKDRLAATDNLWLISKPDRIGDVIPGSSRDIFESNGEFLLFIFWDSIPPRLPPGFVKGKINLTVWRNIDEKYIGILSKRDKTVTIGWIKLTFKKYKVDSSEICLKELGTADFQLKNNRFFY